MADLIKLVSIKNHCNKYLIKVVILKVFLFESKVGQKCYYYHPYQYCTTDPSQTTTARKQEWLAEGYKMSLLLTFKTLNT